MEQRARFIFVILVLVLIAGLFATLYYFYKIDKTSGLDLNSTRNSFYIRIYNNITNQQVVTGYAVYYPDLDIIEKGESLPQGYLKVSALSNTSLYLMTFNQGNESYYASLWNEEPIKIYQDYQVDFHLQPYGSLNFSQTTQIANGKTLNLTINPIGYLPSLIPCVRWTGNFITVKLKDSQTTLIPKHLENKVDRCYEAIPPNSTLILEYDYYGDIATDQTIKVFFVDQDIIKTSVPAKVTDTPDGEDLGKPDIVYTVI